MYADSALSLVAPLCVIMLVFITKRIIASLLIGILIAGLMLGFTQYTNIFDLAIYTLSFTYESILSVFYKDSMLKLSNIYIFGFLFMLGVITELIYHSGGISAFVKWAKNKIDTARKAEFLTFIAGIVIFIDGYFNALIVGQATKSLNDANNSTRERLAYIVDSTAAPMCALVPISSLGAYMLGILATLDEKQGFFLLISSIWGNYYAWFAILIVFLTILWQVNLPAMQRNKNVGIKKLHTEQNTQNQGNIFLLIIPIISLIISVGFLMFYSGYRASNNLHIMDMLAHTDGGFALFWGGAFALLITISISRKNINKKSFIPIINVAFKSIVPVSVILILAWSIGGVIKNDLQTGIYLANLSKTLLDANSLNAHIVIPLIVFAISSIIAFCTGTSWGTLAIMLPIGLSIAKAHGLDFAFIISAVLSGAIYGDHASPISDTTILSATGSGCSVQSHFITQLQYANIAVLISFVGFCVAGGFGSIFAGHIVGIICIIGIFWWVKNSMKAKEYHKHFNLKGN